MTSGHVDGICIQMNGYVPLSLCLCSLDAVFLKWSCVKALTLSQFYYKKVMEALRSSVCQSLFDLWVFTSKEIVGQWFPLLFLFHSRS